MAMVPACGPEPGQLKATGSPRLRRRLGRTMSRARWGEYRALLAIAKNQEYDVRAVETWLADPGAMLERPLLLVRHDVDQHPGSALRMAAIEAELGVLSTWYFRWRTAQPQVVNAIRGSGHTIGLHYETLTRLVLERKLGVADAPDLIPEARELLARELAEFNELFGSARSACPHGDTRVAGVHNGVLLRGQDLSQYGIAWDANDAVGKRGVDVWLSDRSRAEGGWGGGLDPVELMIDRRSPVLVVVHPNNWVSGPALWWDRMIPGGIRTGSDDPRLDARAMERSTSGDQANVGLRPQ
jgi:hypothetical protein